MSTRPLTGYGPRQCLLFDGDEVKYERWEEIFVGYYETAQTVRGNHIGTVTRPMRRNMLMHSPNKSINFRKHDFLHQRELYVQ